MTRDEGIARTVEGIGRSLEYAEQRGVVLCMENHYKDGTWRFPGVRAARGHLPGNHRRRSIPHRSGCSTIPRTRWWAASIPVAFLEKVKHRVVTMHASDRYLAPGATLDDLRTGDGATGYAAALKHGVTGEGMNDYDAIFRILAEVGFDGWISIEDGMNGLDEIARSAEFLKRKRAEYFGPAGV